MTKVYFSPKGGAQLAIVAEINRATSEILVQAYSFTAVPIVAALIARKRAGVLVTVIVDKSYQNEALTAVQDLLAAGVSVFVDAKHAIAHNKVMVLDQKSVVTGSYNFTFEAEYQNAENTLIFHNNKALAAQYRANWQAHLAHSTQLGLPLPTKSVVTRIFARLAGR